MSMKSTHTGDILLRGLGLAAVLLLLLVFSASGFDSMLFVMPFAAAAVQCSDSSVVMCNAAIAVWCAGSRVSRRRSVSTCKHNTTPRPRVSLKRSAT